MNNEEKILEMLAVITAKLNEHDKRFEAMDAKIDAVGAKIGAVDAKVDANHDEAMVRFNNLDNRMSRLSVDLRNFRKEMEDSFAGVYKCLDTTDAQVEQLKDKMA